ncbi:hypothetical protein BC937DRAFT_92510 [Endogone sp. FLAS-F59071]|nr:hypothetical protein BC937DRAFT_92510 [Endogone sp. FLAS-F59071]|eukprot:RUS23092.1 hypothetical protein BC937DRAFT_92510 [Endogone sp. FLAS-F59071]
MPILNTTQECTESKGMIDEPVIKYHHDLDNFSDIDEGCSYTLTTIPAMEVPNFKVLWDIHPETHGEIKIFGKQITTPRYVRSYGKDYFFSGV